MPKHQLTPIESNSMKIIYPVKHLFATTLLAPLIYAIYDPLIFRGTKVWDIYLIFFVSGVLFSIPMFLIYYLVYRGLNTTHLRQLLKKLLLNTSAIIGIFLTLKIIQGSMVNSLFFSYSIALIITSLLINMPRENKLPTT